MDGKRFLRTLRLTNFLSFGEEGAEIPLEPLNVLIGLNASGKSNLIEAIRLLQATPRDLLEPIRQGGGVGEWLWKGAKSTPVAEISVVVEYPDDLMIPLRYQLCFTQETQRFSLVDEAIIREHGPYPDPEIERILSEDDKPDYLYSFQQGAPVISVREVDAPKEGHTLGSGVSRVSRQLGRGSLALNLSVLAQIRDREHYPEITYLGDQFGKIKVFQEWNLGRYTAPRMPQKVDLPDDFLEPDASNLGLVLNNLQHQPGVEKQILSNLREFYEAFDHVTIRIQGGTVQVFVHERGLNQPVPATRLSDGTLRYLCLLTILCHPDPPPLICIEEPELGLHPDILPTIAELMIDASQRTQLIVTTHSEVLVSALTEVPEAVIVCERNNAGTHLRRLERKALEDWLKDYSLGELWRMGEIGGNRW